MKKLLCLVLALSMVLALAACGSKGESSGANGGESDKKVVTTISAPVEIQFWHSISNPVHAEILDKQIAEFNKTVGAEKGITVVSTFNGNGSELYSNVVASIKAGNAPDVTLALRPYVADYLQTPYVVDLAPYINDPEVGIKDYEDIFAGLRDANSNYAQKGVYALPIYSYSEILYYNRDFFEKNNLTVPTTWDEMIDTSRKIHEITGAPAFGWDNLVGSFMTMMLQSGGRYTDQNGNIYFAGEDEAKALEVLKLWQDCAKEGIWRSAGEDMFFSGPFANEQIPMYIGDSVEASYIPKKNPNLNWGTAPIPQMSKDTAANLSAGPVIAALNTTDNAEKAYASYELIKYLTSVEANKDVVIGGTGYLPIRQSVADSQEYKDYLAAGHDYLAAGVDQSSCYFYEPVFTNATTTSSAVNTAVRAMMQEVIDNNVEPQTALNNLKHTVGLN